MYRNLIWALCTVAIVFCTSTKARGQLVPLKNSPSTASVLYLTSSHAYVPTGGTLDLTANPGGVVVTWSISGNADSSFGSITPTGPNTARYFAPLTLPASSPIVTAASVANTAIKATFTVTLYASTCNDYSSFACIRVEPLTRMLKVGESVHLRAVGVHLPPDTPLSWNVKVNGNVDPSGGSLDVLDNNDRLYHTPPTVPRGQVTVAVQPQNSVPGGPAGAAVIIVVAPYVSAHCSWLDGDTNPDCKIIAFDRLKRIRGTFIYEDAHGKVQETAVTDNPVMAPLVQAVNSSKALATGSVLAVKLPNGASASNCKSYDWKIVTQTRESANVLIFNPSDIGSGVCTPTQFVIALPVTALWADVFGFPQLKDPQRGPPASPFHICRLLGTKRSSDHIALRSPRQGHATSLPFDLALYTFWAGRSCSGFNRSNIPRRFDRTNNTLV